MLNILLLLSICTSFSFCAVHDQAQEVFQDDRPVSQPKVEDTTNATELVSMAKFIIISETFPVADIQCNDNGKVEKFTAQYIKDSVMQADMCSHWGPLYPCRTNSASRSYPSEFWNDKLPWGPNKDYCKKASYPDNLEEFPVKIDGTLYAGGNDNGKWRVIYKRFPVLGGKVEVRYCGIVYHVGDPFNLCVPP